MSGAKVEFVVFSKPWKDKPLAELGKFIKGLGFDGIELPIRPDFQVEPDSIAKGLPEAVKILGDCGVKIASIAGPTDEKTFAACAAAGVPIVRTMVLVDHGQSYMKRMEETFAEFDALVPLLEKHGVTLGVQNHCDREISSVMGIRHIVERYDPKVIAAILDWAHCGLAGEQADLAIDILWSHLCMVNFKNAYWKRVSGPEAEVARFEYYWTSGRCGMADWGAMVDELKKRDYEGTICLTAEYSDPESIDRLIVEDFKYAKSLFA